MKKIELKNEDLRVAVEKLLSASDEAGEINYRSKQIQGEIEADIVLQTFPEYEGIVALLSSFGEKLDSVSRTFEGLSAAVVDVYGAFDDADKNTGKHTGDGEREL